MNAKDTKKTENVTFSFSFIFDWGFLRIVIALRYYSMEIRLQHNIIEFLYWLPTRHFPDKYEAAGISSNSWS